MSICCLFCMSYKACYKQEVLERTYDVYFPSNTSNSIFGETRKRYQSIIIQFGDTFICIVFIVIGSYYVIFVRYNPKVLHRRHVCNVIYKRLFLKCRICRYIYDLSSHKIIYTWLKWFVSYRQQTES